MLQLEMQNYLRRYRPEAFPHDSKRGLLHAALLFGLGVWVRSGEDQEPIVWYFPIEQKYEKLWS